MESAELKELWKKADKKAFILTKEHIAELSEKRNRNIYSTLEKWVIINLVFKLISIVGVFLIFILFNLDLGVKVINAGLILVLWVLLMIDMRTSQKIINLKAYSDNLNDNLSKLKTFFTSDFGVYNIFAGFVNPIFIFIGVEFYFMLKYGQMRKADSEDIVVLSIILLISYFIGRIGSIILTKNLKSEIKTSLLQFEDEKEASELLLKKLRQKKLLNIVYLCILILGIIVFLISLLPYLKR